jgi:diguanylate cyclase (GGDEF)-like protein
LRASDRLGRYGGDEFMLLMPGTGAEAAGAVVARLRSAFDDHDWHAITPGLSLAASAGIAEFGAGDDVAALVRRADAALYAAKRSRLQSAHNWRLVLGDGSLKRTGAA